MQLLIGKLSTCPKVQLSSGKSGIVVDIEAFNIFADVKSVKEMLQERTSIPKYLHKLVCDGAAIHTTCPEVQLSSGKFPGRRMRKPSGQL